MNLIRNPQKLEKKLNSNHTYRELFEFNMKLIDLNKIPSDLCQKFYDNNKRFFEV